VAELSVDPADGFGDLVIKAGVAVGEQVLGAGEAGDGGGSQAEDAEGVSERVGVGIGEAGFNQATGVEAMLEGIEVARRGTGAAGGGHSV